MMTPWSRATKVWRAKRAMAALLPERLRLPRFLVFLFEAGWLAKRERLRVLKENAEGTYKTKHAEAARLVYTNTHRHIDTNMNKDRPASKL